MTRNRRTPEQIAADLAVEAQKAQERAALSAAKQNPVLDPLRNKIKKVQTRLAGLKRKFEPTNPQSFDNRLQSYILRMDEIEAGRELAEAELNNTAALLDCLRQDLEGLSQRSAAGEDIAAEAAIAASAEPRIFEDLQERFNYAVAKRKMFKGSVNPQDDEQADAVEA